MENKKAIYQIKDLNHSIMRYCCEIGASKENMPTPAQMQILHYISTQKGKKVYQRDIAVALGLRRANSVKRALTTLGIDSKQIAVKSFGESAPVCTDKTPECDAQNRRAEIKVGL